MTDVLSPGVERRNDLYTSVCAALLQHIPDVAVDFIETEKINEVIRAVLNDHPEIFWFEGKWWDAEKEGRTCARFHYLFSEDEVGEIQSRLIELLNTFQYPESKSRCSIIRNVYDWMISHVAYGTDSASDGQTIYDALITRKAVCKGISKAYQYILRRFGINAILAEGSLDGVNRHVWNVVELDGAAYHVDVCMGYEEFSYLFPDDQKESRYRSFLVSDQTIRRTHFFMASETESCCPFDYDCSQESAVRVAPGIMDKPSGENVRAACDAALKAGTLLGGQYVVREKLGQGGFGITYLTEDRISGKTYAIKECFPVQYAKRAADGFSAVPCSETCEAVFRAEKKRFHSYAKRLSELDADDHVARSYGCFYENGTAYHVMEYVAGAPLQLYLRSHGRLEVREANRMLIPLIQSLQRLHNSSIIHGDIAPDNIMVQEDGSAKLIDFKAAPDAAGRREDMISAPVVKEGFAAIEQYLGKKIQRPYTDVYGMGATYYYVLTGKVIPPAYERLDEDRVLPLSAAGIHVDACFENVLLKAIAVYSALRYQSMEEFCQALQSAERDAAVRRESQRYVTGSRPAGTAEADQSAAPQSSEPIAETEAIQNCGPIQWIFPYTAPIESGPLFEADPIATTMAMPGFGTMAPAAPIGFGAGFEADPIATSMAMLAHQSYSAPMGENSRDDVYSRQIDPDRVRFSAVAPRKITKGDYAIINIVMYEEMYRYIVDEMIAEAEEPVKETKSGFFQVRSGTMVKIVLQSTDLQVEDELAQEWSGGYLDYSFGVLLPEDYRKKQILFTARVYCDDLMLTRLQFIAQCEAKDHQSIDVERHDILSAFVSYASQDRKRVATIIQGMRRVRPELDVFFDVDSLRSGDDWQNKLKKEISERDILFLCWSRFASESKWVDAEWRYALENKGINAIEPIPLDLADRCPPPPELRGKSFNDKLLFIINYDA